MSLGNFSFISRIAQALVIVLAIGVLAFVLKAFLPRVTSWRRAEKEELRKRRALSWEKRSSRINQRAIC